MEKMSDKYGKKFHCDIDIFTNPKDLGFVKVYQCGEMSCEAGFVVEHHKQQYLEISAVIGGKGVNYCGDIGYPVKEGDIAINIPGDEHIIVSSEKEPLRYLYVAWEFSDGVEFEKIKDFFNNINTHRVMNDKFGVSSALSRMVNEFYNDFEFSEEMIKVLITQILCLTYRTWQRAEGKERYKDKKGVGATVYKTIQYIDNNIFEIENVMSVCNKLCYNPSYLSRIFHRNTGKTLQSYLNERKIEAAKELLSNNKMAIKEIAEKLHFESIQSFCRIFKKNTGVSPTQYQKR